MNTTRKPYRDFDLPTKHLAFESSTEHHAPRRATKPEEIERRHGRPRGVLLAEEQTRGLAVAARILWHIQEEEDVAYAQRIIAAAGFNSAWYSFAADANTMRRRLALPRLDEMEDAANSDALLARSAEILQDTVVVSGRLVGAIENHRPTAEQYRTQIGRRLGNASLLLANIPTANKLAAQPELDDFTIQHLARQAALQTVTESRALATQIGVYPSLAGLAHPDNRLSYHIRTQAPVGVVEALEYAQAA